ncbi:hypothetical protein BD413DRAFT_507472 [Trametes elegans]|nr:hypothetical protein BD413DRAFT_507472 [Trametes elegans]
MPSRRVVRIEDLLAEPFGPFAEEEALTSKCPDTTRAKPIILDELCLECNDKLTGLDETEVRQLRFDEERAKYPVRFRGILGIGKLDWLTSQAIEEIEAELREREIQAKLANGSRTATSGLTLERLYAPTPGFRGGQMKVKVMIQGVKNRLTYLMSDRAPDAILLQSRIPGQEYRSYKVTSLHVHTYIRSIHYLGRYRLMRVLQTLLELEGGTNAYKLAHIPNEQRTPEWFIDVYLHHMARHPVARKHRPVYDSDDSDVEPHTGGQMRKGREHTLRHVSRAEVASLFATHAEWLVEEVKLMKRDKLFHVPSWSAWLDDVRRMRHEAAREGRPWGVMQGGDVTMDDFAAMLPPPPRRPKRTRRNNQRRGAPHNVSSTSRPTSSTGRQTHHHERSPTPEPLVPTRSYDRDFSPVSTPPGSPSSSSSAPPSRADPNLAALVPSALFYPPQLTATFQWACDVDGCLFLLDLLRLSDDDLAVDAIPEDDRRRLKGRSWNIREPWVVEAFYYMVDKHRSAHVHDIGLKQEQRGKRLITVPRVARESIPQTVRLRNVRVDDRRPVIKREDDA